MAFQHGETLSFSARFYVRPQYTGKLYFSAPANDYGDEFQLLQTCTATMPAAGATVSPSDSLTNNEGPAYLAYFVAPTKCRLEKIAWSLDFNDPDDSTTHIRIGALKCEFATQGDSTTDNATWRCLGHADTATLTDVGGTVHKGTATFSSSNGDIDKYEGFGFAIESFGDKAQHIYGVVTLILRVIS